MGKSGSEFGFAQYTLNGARKRARVRRHDNSRAVAGHFIGDPDAVCHHRRYARRQRFHRRETEALRLRRYDEDVRVGQGLRFGGPGEKARPDDIRGDAVRPSVADMRGQLSGLIYPGFVTATGYRRLPHLTRYLQGMQRRLDKLPENPARDAANMAIAQRVEQAYQQAVADLPGDADASEARWMLEELRVSLFAQTLGTQGPVSENRVLAVLDRLSA